MNLILLTVTVLSLASPVEENLSLIRWALGNQVVVSQIDEDEPYSLPKQLRNKTDEAMFKRLEAAGKTVERSSWLEAFHQLSQSESLQLYLDFIHDPSLLSSGEAVNPKKLTQFLPLELIEIQKSDVTKALKTIAHKSSDSVSWNGIEHTHEYHNNELRDSVNFLAALLEDRRYDQLFQETFQTLTVEEKHVFQVASNSIDPASRIEAIDLISKALIKNSMARIDSSNSGEGPGFKVRTSLLGYLFEKSLLKLFGAVETAASPEYPTYGIFYDSERVSSKLYLACPAPSDESISVGGMIFETSQFQLINASNQSTPFVWNCDGKQYEISETKAGDPFTIKIPKQLRLESAWQQNELRALTTFSLAPSVDEATSKMVKHYFRLNGYRLKSVRRVNSAADPLAKGLANAHIFIPSTNEPDPGSFRPGWSVADRYEFEKTVAHPHKQGEKLKISLALYAPPLDDGKIPADNQIIRWSPTDIAEILKTRRANLNGDHLVVMNLYCKSTSSFPSWKSAYCQSLKDEQGFIAPELRQGSDFPLVIGSDEGIPSETSFDLAHSLSFPIRIVNLVAEGQTPEEFITGLAKPSPAEWIRVNLVKRLHKLRIHSFDESLQAEDAMRSYVPACNWDKAEITLNSQVEMILKEVTREEQK